MVARKLPMHKGPSKKPDITAIYKTNNSPKIAEDAVVSERMREWFHVLETDFGPDPLHIKMQQIAMLGATARVFEALLYSPQKLGKKIFPFKFVDGLRSVIYHALNPFSQLNLQQQLRFFSHLYELCRTKIMIATPCEYPGLSAHLDVAERNEAYFVAALEYIVTEGDKLHKKIKQQLNQRLNENVLLLNDMVLLLREAPGLFCVGDSPQDLHRANVVRATVVGTLMSFISLDATTLMRGECYLRKEDSKKTTLSKGSIRSIEAMCGKLIEPGKKYRHKQLPLETMISQNEVGAVLASSIAAKITEALQKGAVEQAKELIAMWEKHPFIVRHEEQRELIIGQWLMMSAECGCLALVQYLQHRCQHNSWRAFALVKAARNDHHDVAEWMLASDMPLSFDLLKYAIDIAREADKPGMVNMLEAKSAVLFPTLAPSDGEKENEAEDGDAEMEVLTRRLMGLLNSPDDTSDMEVGNEPVTITFGSFPPVVLTRDPGIYPESSARANLRK